MTPTPDFSVKPTITGEKVVLRPFTEDDLPGMLQMLRDPEVLKLTGSVHDEAESSSMVEEKRFRDWYTSRNDQPDRLDLAVIDRTRGGCVGEAVLNEWESGNRSCSFRIALGPAGRGRGLGTEATRLIVGYGFEQLGMHRISLEVYSFNPRARRVYEKAGFRVEGVLRESLWYGGQWIDATVMSILASEWAEHHGHPSQGTMLGLGAGRRGIGCREKAVPSGHRPDGRSVRISNPIKARSLRPSSQSPMRSVRHVADRPAFVSRSIIEWNCGGVNPGDVTLLEYQPRRCERHFRRKSCSLPGHASLIRLHVTNPGCADR